MKRIIGNGALLIVLAAIVSSCSQDLKEKVSELQSSKKNDSIQFAAYSEFLKDSLNQEFTSTMEDLRSEMDMLIQEQGHSFGASELGDVEVKSSSASHVKNRIGQIRAILESNQSNLDRLISKVEKYDSENKDLRILLASTKAQFEKTQLELGALEQVIASKNDDLKMVSDKLNLILNQNDSLSVALADLDKKAFTGHYLIGSFEELKDGGVVAKEGGIFKIGGVPVLKDEFAAESFNEIDIRNTTKIDVYARKFELISDHPSDSYNVVLDQDEEQVAYLEITNPESFWRSSRYMVAEVK